jgi:hypothetical protein
MVRSITAVHDVLFNGRTSSGHRPPSEALDRAKLMPMGKVQGAYNRITMLGKCARESKHIPYIVKRLAKKTGTVPRPTSDGMG